MEMAFWHALNAAVYGSEPSLNYGDGSEVKKA